MARSAGACELLGYPPDARLLIINADDFGLCHAQNLGTIRSIERGLVSSCSLMVPAPWSLHAIHFLQQNPETAFGVHLTAVSEYAHYRWKPLLPAGQVPSLVDAWGYFPSDDCISDLLSTARLSELESEFRAQIEAVFAVGLQPTHLDSHYHLHECRQDIFDLAVDLGLEYGLALRVGSPAYIDRLRSLGYPTNDHMVLDSGRIEPQDKAANLGRRLRELSPGLSEWALHPGIATEELRAVMSSPRVEGVSGTPQGRQSDYDSITSSAAAEIVLKEGIRILNDRALQRRWAST